MDSSSTQGTGRWASCYWQEKFAVLDKQPRRPGLVADGVLMLPPPFEDLAVAEGLWSELNAELGTLIDVAEEEDISLDELPMASAIVSQFAARARAAGDQILSVTSGQQTAPVQMPLRAELKAAEFAAHLESLADFLARAASEQKPVTLSL